ncbi:hypothetical protein EAI_01713, partial [Harpegnathos saltator]
DSLPGGEIFNEAFKTRLVLPIATPALRSSFSKATIKQYQWWYFRRRSKIHLYSPTFSQALEFMAQEALNVASYSSLNSMRSAISLISHNKFGNHPIVKRFCKDIAALKPPRPR